MYEMLKSKQGREGKQLKMRKTTGNAKKRSCVNILLNVAGINTATTRHSHCQAQPPPTNMMTLPFEACRRTHLRKNWNFTSFWIWTWKGSLMIWTLIILQSKFLGLSKEEHVIILPIVRNFKHQASCEPFHTALSVTSPIRSARLQAQGRENSHDRSHDQSHGCDDQSPESHGPSQ